MKRFLDIRKDAISKWTVLTEGSVPVIYLGAASCGRAAGAAEVLESIDQTLEIHHLKAQVVQVGCIGPCYMEPLMDIARPGMPRISYARVTPERARKLILGNLVDGNCMPRWAFGHFGDQLFTEETGIPRFFDLPMLKPQVRIILKNCGMIDPEQIDHYLAQDGYMGFVKALQMGPEAVISELQLSGLRGRGGAGFTTAKKWETCRTASAEVKYVVCNADEGDPGAFMNRALIESDPHSVLEGILIGGYAIGASHGYIYVRAEYPLAVLRLKTALQQMQDYGLLGKDILGSGFDFDIQIKQGAGAFVCGEETALLASIEGNRGMPRPRPPYPAEKGLYGQPTLINNTETFGTVPHILRNGGKWFQQFGFAGNSGTKTFSLVGKVRHTGLIETPLGITLREIVYEIGGGTEKPFKAVQTGGPLGGCLSSEHLDTPLGYESMRSLGSIMGSGGLIVMDQDTCLVDVARYFLRFSENESCGQCTPCRVGTRLMIETLDKIIRGEGETADLEILRRIADTMTRTSLCGSGQSASNPIQSTLHYFLEEYQTHVLDKYCPSAVCSALFNYEISAERCNGCGRCVDVCGTGAIQGKRKELHVLDPNLCIKCHSCVDICARHAILGIPVALPLSETLTGEVSL